MIFLNILSILNSFQKNHMFPSNIFKTLSWVIWNISNINTFFETKTWKLSIGYIALTFINVTTSYTTWQN
jgi:hypothetical protein